MTNFDGEKLSMQEVKQAIKEYILEEFLPGENPVELTDSTRRENMHIGDAPGWWGSTPYTGTTVCHWPTSAESSTASQTACVARASRKVGPAGVPVSSPLRKSAKALVKVCS